MLSLCVGSLGPSGLKIVPTFTEQMSRLLSTSAARLGNERLLYEESGASKVNLGRVVLFNKRLHRQHRKMLMTPFEKPNDYPDIPIHKYGCRGTGIRHPSYWQHIPEKVPELIVPKDLDRCSLKPYVSYSTKEIYQEELTAKDLFNVIYGKKILHDYREGRLDDEGNPVEPSEEEAMGPEEARRRARKTGSDIFLGGAPRTKLWNVRFRH